MHYCNAEERSKYIYLSITTHLMGNYTKDILEILAKLPEGASVLHISEQLKLNRNSTARYLDIMEHEGIVRSRVIGPTRLYTLRDGLSKSAELTLYKRAMDQASCGITIADANTHDMPIIYVNEAFLHLTGYTREEVLGKNCRFLQGEKTEHSARKAIREALRKKESTTVVITNYTKNGTRFKNELRLAPVTDENGNVTHYIGIQTKL